MTGVTTYSCPYCGVIVRTSMRTMHNANHAAEAGSGGGGGTTTATRLSYHQSTPAAEWSWAHNLNGYPAIVLFADDDPQAPCFTDVTYVDANHVLIEWPAPTSGWAYV